MTSMANEVVFVNLRESLLFKLDHAVEVVVEGRECDVVSFARQELPRLVSGLRALIAQHEPDADGYCRQCKRGSWWRRHHAPCRVLLAYHLAVDGQNPDPQVRRARHRAPERVGT